MRILFLLPFSNARHCHVVANLAGAFLDQGDDIHVFAREATRVCVEGKWVLSKNTVHVQELERELGHARISRLFSQHTRPRAADEALAQSEIERLGCFAAIYGSDAIVLCAANESFHEEMLAKAICDATNGSLIIKLHVVDGHQSWVMDMGGVSTPLPAKNSIGNFIKTHVRTRLDAAHSSVRAENILRTYAQAAVFQSAFDAAETGLFADKTCVAVPSRTVQRVSDAKGEVESVKDGDVLLDDSLWLKGWVDFGNPEVKCLQIHINEQVHRCYPNVIRGELVDRHRSNVMGFEVQIPVNAEGPRLKISINLMTRDGKEHGWRKLTLWADKSIPPRYRTPVVAGHAQVLLREECMQLRGQLSTEKLRVRAIRAVSLGRELCAQVAEPPCEHVEFDMACDLAAIASRSAQIHLWLELDDGTKLFWSRVAAPGDALAAEDSDLIQGLGEGSVLNGSGVTARIQACSDAKAADMFINGIAVARAVLRDGVGDVHAQLADHANNLLIEVRDDTGLYASRLVWRHIESPETRTHKTVITVTREERFLQSVKVEHRKAINRVVVIRRAPAPTDELYILAPLKKFVDRKSIQVEILDTDDVTLDDEAFDRMFPTGTHVIASRYVTDDLVKRLTARKPSLGSVFYLMDDDVAAAEDSRWLPGGYRSRMMVVAHGQFQSMVTLCDRFIVTCEFLRKRYHSDKTDLLEPPFLHPPRNLDHLRRGNEIVIAYHGTMVHRDDIAAISPALRQVHDKYPNVRIQIVMGDYVPSVLKGLPRVEVVPAMPWEDYKKFVQKARAHIALAPILETPYNMGKSVVKIMDIAALGAVGIYTRREPYTKYVKNCENGFLLENDPLMWQQTMSWLIEYPAELHRIAEAGQELAKRVGNIAPLESYWEASLGIE